LPIRTPFENGRIETNPYFVLDDDGPGGNGGPAAFIPHRRQGDRIGKPGGRVNRVKIGVYDGDPGSNVHEAAHRNALVAGKEAFRM
jgi:hypothetical protein